MKKTVLVYSIFCILFSLFSFFNCHSQTQKQTNDTLAVKKHSPKKASWLAIAPGAGQIYNKKYWKLPIVYGGLGASGFLIYYYADWTSIYSKEYRARVNEDVDNLNDDLAHISKESILQYRNTFRRNMEISIAACAIVYMLSI